MSLRARVEARLPAAACKRAVVGFDGFIDTIARPLRATAAAGQPAQPFETIADFGAYLVGQAGKSCSVALSINSCRFICMPPSPVMTTTSVSGFPSWAPIAAGKP